MPTKRRIGRFFFLVASLLLVNHCARNPATGRREIVLVSESQEIAQGRAAHPQVLAEFGRLENPELQNYLNGVGQKLARISHRPELEWHFTVVDVPVINAFALPGGYIYFTREILAHMNSEAELAGVLGHEIGHVTARHSVSQMTKAQLFGLGLGLGTVISPTFYRLSDLAQTGVGLLFLKYGRDDERQSDELGIGYMAEAGYDPRQMSGFFVVFQRLREEANQSVPGWLSTHPDPANRVTDTAREAERILQAGPNRDRIVARERFLRQIDGIVVGDNPREGFQEQDWFLHPQLKFKIRFPQGWRVQNSKRSVVSAPARGEAAIRLTLAQAPRDITPRQYAGRVAQQQGVTLLDGRSTRINGNPAFLGVYRLRDPQVGSLNVLAAFIDFQGRLYEVLGLTSGQLYRQYAPIFQESLTSFSELTDRRALSVQPDRLRTRTVRQGDTLRSLTRNLNSPRIDLETHALLNRIDPDEPLGAGTLIKVVQPGRR